MCPYCGTVIDAGSHLAMGRSKRRKIDTPLLPGMKGIMEGELFQVIGLLRCLSGNESWDTAFLLSDQDHLLAVRRHSGGRGHEFMEPTEHSTDAPSPSAAFVSLDGRDMPITSRLQARIAYIEGQVPLTIHKKSTMHVALCPGHRVEWAQDSCIVWRVRSIPFATIRDAFNLAAAEPAPEPLPEDLPEEPAPLPPATPPTPRRFPIFLVSISFLIIMLSGLCSSLSSIRGSLGLKSSGGTISTPGDKAGGEHGESRRNRSTKRK